jgi:hypothetical protein
MFTNENLKQYAVLKAMGATSRQLLGMILCPGRDWAWARPLRHHWPDRTGGRVPVPHDVVHAADRGGDGRAGEHRGCSDQRSPRAEARTRHRLCRAIDQMATRSCRWTQRPCRTRNPKPRAVFTLSATARAERRARRAVARSGFLPGSAAGSPCRPHRATYRSEDRDG